MTNTAVNSGFPHLTDSIHDLICLFELRMINDCSFVRFYLACIEISGSHPNVSLRKILGGHVMIMFYADSGLISFLHFFFFVEVLIELQICMASLLGRPNYFS